MTITLHFLDEDGAPTCRECEEAATFAVVLTDAVSPTRRRKVCDAHVGEAAQALRWYLEHPAPKGTR